MIPSFLFKRCRSATSASSRLATSVRMSSISLSSAQLPLAPAMPRIELKKNTWQHRYYHYDRAMMKQTKISDAEVAKNNNNASQRAEVIYLHIAPCGDYWTGTSIFAAKHLQPDYVRSVALPPEFEEDHVDILEEILDREGMDVLQKIYDSKCLPWNVGVMLEEAIKEKQEGSQ